MAENSSDECLYTGPALDLFLADRLAVGFNNDVICADFENLFGHPLKESELEEFRAANAGLIQDRYERLVKRIEEESLFGRVLRITRKIESLVESQFDAANSRQLASLLSVLRAYQEMLIAKSRELKSNAAPAPALDFMTLFSELESEGIVEVKDRSRLESILEPTAVPTPTKGVSFVPSPADVSLNTPTPKRGKNANKTPLSQAEEIIAKARL